MPVDGHVAELDDSGPRRADLGEADVEHRDGPVDRVTSTRRQSTLRPGQPISIPADSSPTRAASTPGS